MESKKKKVKCVTCTRTVVVKLIRMGDGHVGTCPVCKKLAYNGK